MLMIRLQRRGKKHQPFYRLVVGEKRSKLKGKQLEELGWYDPRVDNKSNMANKSYKFNKERVLYWLSKGAQASATVHNLLVRTGALAGKKIPKHKLGKNPAAAVKKSAGESPPAASVPALDKV